MIWQALAQPLSFPTKHCRAGSACHCCNNDVRLKRVCDVHQGARTTQTRARPAAQLARTFTADSLTFNLDEQASADEGGAAVAARGALERSDSVTFPTLPAPRACRPSHSIAIRKQLACKTLEQQQQMPGGHQAGEGLLPHEMLFEAPGRQPSWQASQSVASGSHAGSATVQRRGTEMPAVTSPKSTAPRTAKRVRRSTAKGSAFAAMLHPAAPAPQPAAATAPMHRADLAAPAPPPPAQAASYRAFAPPSLPVPAAGTRPTPAQQPPLVSPVGHEDGDLLAAFTSSAAARAPAASHRARVLALTQAAAAEAVVGAQRVAEAAADAANRVSAMPHTSRLMSGAADMLLKRAGTPAAPCPKFTACFRHMSFPHVCCPSRSSRPACWLEAGIAAQSLMSHCLTGGAGCLVKPTVSLFHPVPVAQTAANPSLQLMLKQHTAAAAAAVSAAAVRTANPTFMGLPAAPETPALNATRSPTPFQPWMPQQHGSVPLFKENSPPSQ